MHPSRWILSTSILLLTASVLTITLRNNTANAGATIAPDGPTVVTVLDLEKVLNGLDRIKQSRDEFQKRQADIEAELQNLNSEIEDLKSNRDVMTPDSKEYKQISTEIELKSVLLQARSTYESEKLHRDDVLAMQKYYQEIVAGLADFAKENGIDLVTLASKPGDFPVDAQGRILNAQQTQQLMLSWQTMYIDPDIDITDRFIEYMNSH